MKVFFTVVVLCFQVADDLLMETVPSYSKLFYLLYIVCMFKCVLAVSTLQHLISIMGIIPLIYVLG